MWSIFYADGSRVDGVTDMGWRAAPDVGVQVVVEWRTPELHERRWANVGDRRLWTGTDEYDPFGWGVKIGTLLPDEDYWRIWQEAAHGDR